MGFCGLEAEALLRAACLHSDIRGSQGVLGILMKYGLSTFLVDEKLLSVRTYYGISFIQLM